MHMREWGLLLESQWEEEDILVWRREFQSHYIHSGFTSNYKSQALIHLLLWLLSSGQYGQSIFVTCHPRNLVPLWGEKQNQSNLRNQQSGWTLQPGNPMFPVTWRRKTKTHGWLNQDLELDCAAWQNGSRMQPSLTRLTAVTLLHLNAQSILAFGPNADTSEARIRTASLSVSVWVCPCVSLYVHYISIFFTSQIPFLLLFGTFPGPPILEIKHLFLAVCFGFLVRQLINLHLNLKFM